MGPGDPTGEACQPVDEGPADPFDPRRHPDGNRAVNLRCEDDGGEQVCVRYAASNGTVGLCRACGEEGKYYPGCECSCELECIAKSDCVERGYPEWATCISNRCHP